MVHLKTYVPGTVPVTVVDADAGFVIVPAGPLTLIQRPEPTVAGTALRLMVL